MRRSMLFIMVVLTSAEISAQTDDLAAGRTHFNNGEWEKAATSLRRAAEADAQSGTAWFWLGLAHYQLERYDQAKIALEKANDLNTITGFTRFSIARCAARMNDLDGAFSWLEKAASAGFNALARFDADSAMMLLKHDSRFARTRESIDKNVRPTEYDARFRQLDFWIGDWNVFDQGGLHVGTNTITKELEGAMLVERWTNAFGVSGSSINYFDPGSGKFKQQWVSQSGYNTSYEGGLVGKSMVMVGKNANADGTTSMNRMTFTPNDDGSVTQLIETTNDEGKTWTQSFLGTYRKRSRGTKD